MLLESLLDDDATQYVSSMSRMDWCVCVCLFVCECVRVWSQTKSVRHKDETSSIRFVVTPGYVVQCWVTTIRRLFRAYRDHRENDDHLSRFTVETQRCFHRIVYLKSSLFCVFYISEGQSIQLLSSSFLLGKSVQCHAFELPCRNWLNWSCARRNERNLCADSRAGLLSKDEVPYKIARVMYRAKCIARDSFVRYMYYTRISYTMYTYVYETRATDFV